MNIICSLLLLLGRSYPSWKVDGVGAFPEAASTLLGILISPGTLSNSASPCRRLCSISQTPLRSRTSRARTYMLQGRVSQKRHPHPNTRAHIPAIPRRRFPLAGESNISDPNMRAHISRCRFPSIGLVNISAILSSESTRFTHTAGCDPCSCSFNHFRRMSICLVREWLVG